MNDYVTQDVVSRFVGYGGVYYRQHLEAKCHYYIRSHSLSPILPLALTQAELKFLDKNEMNLVQKGLGLIEAHEVKV